MVCRKRAFYYHTLERNSRPSKPNVCNDNNRNGHQKNNDNKDKNNQSGMWVNFSLRPQLTKRENNSSLGNSGECLIRLYVIDVCKIIIGSHSSFVWSNSYIQIKKQFLGVSVIRSLHKLAV